MPGNLDVRGFASVTEKPRNFNSRRTWNISRHLRQFAEGRRSARYLEWILQRIDV